MKPPPSRILSSGTCLNRANEIDLRHYEEDRDVDSHQAVEIDAALVDQDSVGEQRERACCQRVAVAVQSYADERIAAYLERSGEYQDRESP